MSFDVVKHPSATSFLERATPWLLRSEAENNLVLGIAHQMAEDEHGAKDVLLATIESDGHVAGCAFRTPPFKLGITRMPLKAIPPLADIIGQSGEQLPGVLGPREESRYFARIWCGPRALSFRPVMDQRIYSLDELTDLEVKPEGGMRPASDADRDLVLGWLRQFFEETRMPASNAEHVASRMLSNGSMFVWVNGGDVVSMAGITGWTPNGARIGFVFTPHNHRRQGYGTAITAALTKRQLDQGRRCCFLFTDADNPTSNRIYQTLGFRPVADVVDYQFF